MTSAPPIRITRPAARALRPTSDRLPLRPAALACLALLASCGGDSNEPEASYTSLYPTLAAHAAMDEEDFTRYLQNASRGIAITQDSIKSLSVGSSIDSAASTYTLRPIFDLGRLKADNWLNVDTTRSQEKTELRLTSNKAASSASSQTTIDGSASGSYAGFKAAAAYHQANAWQKTNSDGSISIQMVSSNTNNVVSILNSGFTGSENLTPYLIGTQLTAEQLRGYVSVAESAPTDSCGGESYIADVTVGSYKLIDTEPYANIQLLTRMEATFADLRAQHGLCSDPAIRSHLILLMTNLRGKIESAIADFYAFNGDSFVSKTTSMNQGIGKGTLTFSSADGNTEAQYGASLSVEYQALNAFGAGAGGAFQYYKQNGWANAVQNVQVSAESMPAGVADTTAWVSSIYTMLKDQSKSEVPPLGSLPKDPGVNLPAPVGPKKEEQDEPPDVAFTSYDQWKQYQADKKRAKDAEELERARQRAENQPLIVNDNTRLQTNQGNNTYLKLIAELDELKQRASLPRKPLQANEGNLVRFDKMYVNGFETLPYDAVIPQLRPNLDIPGVDKTIGSFPQLMEMMLVVEKLGKLDSYLGFLANLSISNITPEMSTRYHQFFQTASSRAYDLVTLALSQGADITPAVLTGYKQAMFGTDATKAQSELYKSLQDMDYYNYAVGTLLDPVKGKTWVAAPGGYMPMRWTSNGGAQLVTWTELSSGWGQKARDSEGVVAVDFSNPNTNPLSLYQSMKAIQTPWYPVYIFNQGSAPTLVFVQNFGAYQAIYGAHWVVRPRDSETVKPSLKPLWADYQVLGNEIAGSSSMRAAVVASDNSFLDRLSWDYSVYFPQSGNDPTRLQKFNALVLGPDPIYLDARKLIPEPLYDKVIRFNQHSMASRHFSQWTIDNTNLEATYNAFRRFPTGSSKDMQRKMRRMSDGEVVSLDEHEGGPQPYLMLLPLNATTAGENLKQAFNYAPERTPMNIVTTTSLDLVNKLAVLLE